MLNDFCSYSVILKAAKSMNRALGLFSRLEAKEELSWFPELIEMDNDIVRGIINIITIE